MAIQSIQIILRASYADAKRVDNADFFAKLATKDFVKEHRKSQKAWQAARVILCQVEASADGDINSDFSREVEAVAEWLTGQSETAFEEMRNIGLKIDIFLGTWINDDQIDLRLPVSLLRECTRLGLAIELVSND